MHPVMFRSPSGPIYSTTVMLVIAMVAGFFLSWRLARTYGDRPGATDLVISYIAAYLAGAGGAALYWMFENAADRPFGLQMPGGLLGGTLAVWGVAWARGVPFLVLADVVAPSVALGAALTRIGCYLFGCDFGKPLGEGAPSWLRALGTFPRWPEGMLPNGMGSPAWATHVAERLISRDATASLPVHPTQLYEVLAELALLGALLALFFRARRFPGQIFLTFVIGYAAIRFCIEAMLGDRGRLGFGPALSMRALVVVGLLAMAAAYAAGPALSIASVGLRRASMGFACLPAAVAWLIIPASTSFEEVELTSGQGFALAMSALSAWAYRVLLRHPAAAVDESAAQQPRKKRKRKKKLQVDDAS